MFRTKIKKGRKNDAEEIEEKVKSVLERCRSKENNRLNFAHFGLFLHSYSKKHENHNFMLYNK